MLRRPHTHLPPPAPDDAPPYDGVVCLGGEDWWYHNRGHYDMRLARAFARTMPVLYVNSIGMRVPSPTEGRMFVARMRRKLRSIRRGLVPVDERFAVLSPLAIPTRAGLRLGRGHLARTIAQAAAARGIHAPLVWVACPPAAEIVDALAPVAVVYQRTDRFEDFPGADSSRVRRYDAWLKARADVTLFCSHALHAEEAADCRHARLLEHGVDVDRFVEANERPPPADIRDRPRPRVGFVGAIDRHTFDPELFLELARTAPDLHFVLVGPCSLPSGWCIAPNVTALGQRAPEEVPAYMTACDALIMPFNRSSWIQACSPVKLKEYLAAGRPVVSVGFPEADRYGSVIRTANDARGFVAALRTVLDTPPDAETLRDRVRGASWSDQARTALDAVDEAMRTPATGATPFPLFRSSAVRPPRGAAGIATAQAVEVKPPSSSPRLQAATLELAECIILTGGLSPSPLAAAVGTAVLDLWLTERETVGDRWRHRLAELTSVMETAPPIRIVHRGPLPPPWPFAEASMDITVEREPSPLRGTAGTVRDLCLAYPPDAHVLVVEGDRYLPGSLVPLVEDHATRGADVTVAVDAHGVPAGLSVIRCGALASVPSRGFVDLDEQWLPGAIDTGARAFVHHQGGCPGAGRARTAASFPLRTREQFLAAARHANDVPARVVTAPTFRGGLVPPGTAGLRVICAGAVIGPGARVVDSILMPGAVVAANTLVVRSLLCPNTRTQPGTDIVDAIVTARAAPARRLPGLRIKDA